MVFVAGAMGAGAVVAGAERGWPWRPEVRCWSTGALRPSGTWRGLPHWCSSWWRPRPRSAPSTRPVSSC